MADQAVEGGKGFVVEWRVEQLARENRRLSGPPTCTALAPAGPLPVPPPISSTISPKRQAEGCLEQAAMLDIAGQLDRHGAARAAHAQRRITLGAVGQDERAPWRG